MTIAETRVAAVKAFACPKCGSPAGYGCKTKNGGRYDPIYTVHKTRMLLWYAEQK